ncbi:MAG: hypothetical protein CMD31_00160 [Flavobacteriales bacterium]|nr:hypothetical protein [Flavobacteriales bacterium]|tara:strand:+ start:9564 stop:10811 length:1248 start_codon:yes stop_codon:yes gene_type:complete
MKKEFLDFLKGKNITEDDFKSKDAAEMGKLYNEFYQDQLAQKANKDDIPNVAELLKDYLKEGDLKTINKQLEDIIETVNQLKDNNGGDAKPKTLSEEIAEKKEDIFKIAQGGAGEVEIKALTNRASVTNSPSGFVLPEIGQLGVKERSLYNVLPKVSVSDGNHTGTVRYRDWDESTTVRAAAMVAEGAAFPESTAKWEWYTKDLRKVGDTLPVTVEFLEDEQQAAAELDMFLEVNVETEVDDQLVNGNNTGQNLDGLLNASPAYTAVASSLAAPNLKDLVIKMRNDITRSRGSKYRPDIVVVASSTMEDLVLAKDANNNYIFDENTGTLGGMTVVVDENLADNTIIVGDRRYARIYEKPGITLSRGYVGQQFVEDELTIKARKRLLLLVREVDKTGFRKVADVAAALTTLATDPA